MDYWEVKGYVWRVWFIGIYSFITDDMHVYNVSDSMKRLESKIEKILEGEMFKTLVYWKDSKPIGYLIFTIFPKKFEAYILNIYIEDRNKENGFENKLVEELKFKSDINKINMQINP